MTHSTAALPFTVLVMNGAAATAAARSVSPMTDVVHMRRARLTHAHRADGEVAAVAIDRSPQCSLSVA